MGLNNHINHKQNIKRNHMIQRKTNCATTLIMIIPQATISESCPASINSTTNTTRTILHHLQNKLKCTLKMKHLTRHFMLPILTDAASSVADI